MHLYSKLIINVILCEGLISRDTLDHCKENLCQLLCYTMFELKMSCISEIVFDKNVLSTSEVAMGHLDI